MSPRLSFPRVLAPSVSKVSVTATSFRHTYFTTNRASNSSRVSLPSSSLSSCLNMAARLSSVVPSSSLPSTSGSLPTKAAKSAGTSPTSLSRAAIERPLSPMYSSRAPATTLRLAATRKSSPPLSSSGAVASVLFFTSASISPNISATSWCILFAVMHCSCTLVDFFAPARSAWYAVNCACSFFRLSMCSGLCRMSFSVVDSHTRISPTLAWTTFSISMYFKQMVLASSTSMVSASPLMKGPATSTAAFTSPSSSPNFTSVSCSLAVIFLPARSFQNWLSVCEAVLIR
mmetsp:Transcript_9379/g.25597  ORF Transcript_9379/g.25597 Transcript_9379/m.25597 type:complete len:288 (-) Transcript_9379:258-1121(-)